MKKIIPFTIFVLSTVVLLAACSSNVSSEQNEPKLKSIAFTKAVYGPDENLVVRIKPAAEVSKDFFKKNSVSITVTTSSGNRTSAQVSPWSNLSDEEMVAAIENGADKAILRIKPADKENARNAEGNLVRSEKAMNNFINWVETQEKLNVTWVSKLLPYVVIKFTTGPTLTLVNEVRAHINVEFMEPNAIGTYTSVNKEPQGDLAVIILASGTFDYKAGETVTATYKQPNGSLLKATAVIRD